MIEHETIVAIKDKKRYKGGGFFVDYPHPLHNRWTLEEDGLDTYREFLYSHIFLKRGVVYNSLKTLFYVYRKSNRIVLMANQSPDTSHCKILSEVLKDWENHIEVDELEDDVLQ